MLLRDTALGISRSGPPAIFQKALYIHGWVRMFADQRRTRATKRDFVTRLDPWRRESVRRRDSSEEFREVRSGLSTAVNAIS
jgi:hypothetical protein